MKYFVVALCIVACAFAADKDAQILRSDFEQTPEGNYQYNYESDNGISGQAQGIVRALGNGEQVIEVSGSNSYKNPEGEIISLTYVADENGYRAQGAHLPTPPPAQLIPDYIQRSIDYIAAHPYVEKQ